MQADIISRMKFIDEKLEKIDERSKKHKDIPHYLIQCDGIFNDNDAGTECLWVDIGSERHSEQKSHNEKSDGKIIAEDVIICMDYGTWGPLIHESMVTGKVLDLISIYRLHSHNQKLYTTQELKYENCIIKTYRQTGDRILFSFGYTAVEDLKINYDSKGVRKGQIGMRFDYTKLKAEVIK